jgi:hypothetical protein
MKMGSKHEILPRLGIRLLLICDKQGLEYLHPSSGKILALANLIQLNCSEYGLQT